MRKRSILSQKTTIILVYETKRDMVRLRYDQTVKMEQSIFRSGKVVCLIGIV